MNANELADELDSIQSSVSPLEIMQATKMLRQQQNEIEALKEKVMQNADLNEKVYFCKKKLKPIVWMSEVEGGTMYTNYEYPESIPLYTHPAKTLIDEEILKMASDYLHYTEFKQGIQFARAILRKAQEK